MKKYYLVVYWNMDTPKIDKLINYGFRCVTPFFYVLENSDIVRATLGLQEWLENDHSDTIRHCYLLCSDDVVDVIEEFKKNK
jgi:hypothetical protein